MFNIANPRAVFQRNYVTRALYCSRQRCRYDEIITRNRKLVRGIMVLTRRKRDPAPGENLRARPNKHQENQMSRKYMTYSNGYYDRGNWRGDAFRAN